MKKLILTKKKKPTLILKKKSNAKPYKSTKNLA